MAATALFFLISLRFSGYLEGANTLRADSRRLKSGTFTTPKNYILPVERRYREAYTTLKGGRNSAGIFTFGGFAMSILNSSALLFPVSPAAEESSQPEYPTPKKQDSGSQFVGGMDCCEAIRALEVGVLQPADNFSSDDASDESRAIFTRSKAVSFPVMPAFAPGSFDDRRATEKQCSRALLAGTDRTHQELSISEEVTI